MKVSGMSDPFTFNAQKPCDQCVILLSVAELQYADGSSANSSTWLHHTGVMRTGPGLKDPNCGIPGIEGLFEQGNEKDDLPKTDNTNGLKVGYHIKQTDKFVLSSELVNEKTEPQYVWVAVNYEYFDGPHPEYKDTKALLLSVGISCNKATTEFGTSNLTIAGQPKSKIFSEHSSAWVSPFDGDLVATVGHLHDGGQSVDIFLNDKQVCHSTAKYAAGPASTGGMGGKSMGGKGMQRRDEVPGSYEAGAKHLAGMDICTMLTPIKKGDKIRLVANYDLTSQSGMKNNKGELDEVMGMAGIVMAV
jgi:hypothetical protein